VSPDGTRVYVVDFHNLNRSLYVIDATLVAGGSGGAWIVAEDDRVTTVVNQSVFGDVLSNDFVQLSPSEIVELGDGTTVALITGPFYGSLSLNSDGTFTYTPRYGYTGMDEFKYSVSYDALHGTASVYITITAEQSTEPSNPTDPPTDPIDPPTDPINPPTDPTDPPTDPTDPSKKSIAKRIEEAWDNFTFIVGFIPVVGQVVSAVNLGWDLVQFAEVVIRGTQPGKNLNADALADEIGDVIQDAFGLIPFFRPAVKLNKALNAAVANVAGKIANMIIDAIGDLRVRAS
ncbi:Ig-like domain-containing protein, partial [Mycolicibacterium phlei]